MFAHVLLILILGAQPSTVELQRPLFEPPVLEVPAAVKDTLNLYGGPGVLEGKFETASEQPDRQGWTTRDDTAPADSLWSQNTYHAANLDGTVPGNHAWWCGWPLPACADPDQAGGYGNNWNTSLAWSAAVQDKTLPATVTVSGILNADTETGYDYLYLSAMTASGPVHLLVLDGVWSGLAVQESLTLEPGDYGGENSDQVQLEVRFISDGGFSDEDCDWPTVGACQVDNLQVEIQQPGLEAITSPTETCEPGEYSSWTPIPQVGVGNFAQLWTGLDDLDPDQANHSPQWAWLDDGLIVPGTGGSYCQDGYWCYGPDSLVVNIDGGLLGPGHFLRNSVISPAVPLPDNEISELMVSLDAYLHNEFNTSYFDPVYLTWSLDWTTDPAGLDQWHPWEGSYSFIYLDTEGGQYKRISSAVATEGLAPEARFVRLVVTAGQLPIWDWGFHYATPAPYFDNVRLQAVGGDSPAPAENLPGFLQVSCSPNPFNPSVDIRWQLPEVTDLEVTIYDLSGALVRTLHRGPAPGGQGEVIWRGDDDRGRKLAAGAYFCRVAAGSELVVRKLMLLK